MKKIVLAVLCALFAVAAYCQNEYETRFMRFYVPDCLGSPFSVSVDTYILITEKDSMFIKTHANFNYNASEFSYFQKYAIPKGNSLYLELDNGDTIKLTCSLDKDEPDGFVTTKNGVYQNYAGYSYFPVNADIIDRLKNHNIIKVRGQFKFEEIDGSMQFTSNSDMPNTKTDFLRSVQSVLERHKSAKK